MCKGVQNRDVCVLVAAEIGTVDGLFNKVSDTRIYMLSSCLLPSWCAGLQCLLGGYARRTPGAAAKGKWLPDQGVELH